MKLEQLVSRRTEELFSSTRSEILASIGAAVLFVAIMAWRFAPAYDRRLLLGFAVVIVWVIVSLYRYRSWIRREDSASTDAFAATGLQHYRRELERRRDHLRNAWLWHGPLLLSCLILLAVLTSRSFAGFERLRNILPLLVLLAAWTGFGFWRRRRLAKEVQAELDEIDPLGRDS